MTESSSKPEFSVIVLFDRGRPEPCLSSILSQKGADFEVIAVTNPGAAINAPDRVKVIETAERNPARRRNLASRAARGDILAFLDDDAEAPEDWLSRAARVFSESPDMAGMGGSNTAPENQDLMEKISDLILATPLIGSGNTTYHSDGQPREARPGDLHLSNFFVRRSAFDEIGGFNENIGYGAEDSEFIYTGKIAFGMKFRFYPAISVKHRRRRFGLPYLGQRFNFRRQNGRLMLAYPGMYSSNRSLQAAGAALVSAIILVAVWPGIWIWLAAGYYLSTLIFSMFSRSPSKKKLYALLPIIPFAYLLHHGAYLAGLFTGLAEGLILTGPKATREKFKR